MEKTIHVSGTVEIRATVRLPVATAREAVACDDPAVEAILESLPQYISIYLWGEDKPPAQVVLEAHEDDVTIDEDDRA